MAFQIRDETAGLNIVYIDNSGLMGLGSLPNSGQQLTVQGTSVISTSGSLACSIMGAGAPAPFEGSVAIPATSSVTVAITAAAVPTVSSDVQSTGSSSSGVTFDNPTSGTVTAHYSIW